MIENRDFYVIYCANPICDNDIARVYADGKISSVSSKVRRSDVDINKKTIHYGCKCGTRNEIIDDNGIKKSIIAKVKI
jgi:hypothetical protein